MNSMIKWGFKNFMFINMHAGNVPIIGQIAREYQREYGIHCAQIDWWQLSPARTPLISAKIPGGWHTVMPANAGPR